MKINNKFEGKGKYGLILRRVDRIRLQAEHLNHNRTQMSKINDSQLPLINRHPSRYVTGKTLFFPRLVGHSIEGLIPYSDSTTPFIPRDQEKTLHQDPSFSKLVRIIQEFDNEEDQIRVASSIKPLTDKFFDRSLTEKEYFGILDGTLKEMQEIEKCAAYWRSRKLDSTRQKSRCKPNSTTTPEENFFVKLAHFRNELTLEVIRELHRPLKLIGKPEEEIRKYLDDPDEWTKEDQERDPPPL